MYYYDVKKPEEAKKVEMGKTEYGCDIIYLKNDVTYKFDLYALSDDNFCHGVAESQPVKGSSREIRLTCVSGDDRLVPKKGAQDRGSGVPMVKPSPHPIFDAFNFYKMF